MNTETRRRPYGVAPPHFRLPEATALGPVHLLVSNLERSLEYYQQVLGFRAEQRGDHRAVLTAHNDTRPLVTLRTRPGVTRARRGAFGLYHFAILLPDRPAVSAARSVREAGYAVDDTADGVRLVDPWGTAVRLHTDKGTLTRATERSIS